MTKSFRSRLIRTLLFGTIIPTVCFISLFIFKHISIEYDAHKTLFKEESIYFNKNVQQNVANAYELIETALVFLSDENLLENDSQKYKLLNQIVFESNVLSYHFINDDLTLSKNFEVIEEASKETVYRNKYIVYSNEESIFFGVVNENASLVFEYDYLIFKSSIENYLDSDYQYNLSGNNTTIMQSIDYFNDLTKDENKIYQDRKFIQKMSLEDPYDFVSVTIIKDISWEIIGVLKYVVALVSLLLIYLLLTITIVRKSSKLLLKPLNKLINTVGLIANDHIETNEVMIVEDEYKEIYQSFDEMIINVSTNINEIEQQSLDINEKNATMEDMNVRLNESLSYLKQSTDQLKMLEKQSKTLVDNIKDLMWVLDAKGRIVYINNIVFDKLGYVVNDLIGVKLDNILQRNYLNEDLLQDLLVKDLNAVDLVFLTKEHDSEEIYSCNTKRIYSNDKLIKIQGVCREITEERYLEKQMIQKNDISNTLNEISEILTRPEKLDFLLKHIVIRIEKLLNPLICTIRMVDEKGRLHLKAGIGEFFGLVQEKYLNMDKDISGKAIKEGKIIILTDKNEDDYDNYLEVSPVVEQAIEMVFLPLEYDGTTIGVMSLGLKNHLTESDLKILKVFTNQASAAIEKARMYEEIESNYFNIIKALVSTVEAKDTYTENHSIRVSQYSRMIAEEMGLSKEEVGYIDIAGLLHDIGKIGISDLILTKNGKLTDKEFKQIKKHPLNGGRIVSEMKLHKYIVDGVLLHHKRFDLKGYPEIDIDSLPLSARIIGVADAFDAMTSNRSYQEAKTFNEAFIELRDCSGKQFCPEVVNIMEHVIIKLRQMAS